MNVGSSNMARLILALADSRTVDLNLIEPHTNFCLAAVTTDSNDEEARLHLPCCSFDLSHKPNTIYRLHYLYSDRYSLRTKHPFPTRPLTTFRDVDDQLV